KGVQVIPETQSKIEMEIPDPINGGFGLAVYGIEADTDNDYAGFQVPLLLPTGDYVVSCFFIVGNEETIFNVSMADDGYNPIVDYSYSMGDVDYEDATIKLETI